MKKILVIDAANLKSGGAVTHLTEVLNQLPSSGGFAKITIFGGDAILDKIKAKPWIEKKSHKWLNKGLFFIVLWRIFIFKKKVSFKDSLIFAPAGTHIAPGSLYCVMSRNMLIFDSKESARYGWSWRRLKFIVLRWVQKRSFNKASLIIFISVYAKNVIMPFLNRDIRKMPVIYHGINKRFQNEPKQQRGISSYTFEDPFRLLYVSPIDVYKHQWVLCKAASQLRRDGYPIQIELVGESYSFAMNTFTKALVQIKDHEQFIRLHGKVPYESIHQFYKNADGFVYCSTCENMPNILMEAMNSGLPIACSNYQPMPEFLGESEFYFDPTSEDSVHKVLKYYLDNPERRFEHAKRSYQRSLEFSWEKCARETFSALSTLTK